MRATVFTDRALAKHAGQFVWLDLNTEDEKNAAWQEKVPVEALPTYLVVKPENETVVLRGVGAMTVAEIGASSSIAARCFFSRAAAKTHSSPRRVPR